MQGGNAGLALVAIGVSGFAALAVFRLPFDEFVLGPLAVLLVVGTLALESRGWFRPRRLPTLLGDASYSIYLWHTFAISVVVKVCARAGLDLALSAFLAVLSRTALGVAAYVLLEKPLTRRLRPRMTPKPLQQAA